jgi:hypothetical protein
MQNMHRFYFKGWNIVLFETAEARAGSALILQRA